ncbi:helix-turn-helix domain-containing protein [Streptomyces carpinensis]|uniref:LuxR C-terminal-related transcriptional regulator n=1 Tax=Streptomyces carpinensis TaxID=66369 RepID=A0ABV1W1M7_9ACTN|nr:helix-turn-helix transcriptional regulator [Streptomyces carpinensis]
MVEEVLRTFMEGSATRAIPARPEALDDLAVPAVLREVVVQRLLTLDDDAREVLNAAAVLGLVTDDRLLAKVTERDAGEIARSLAGAQAVGLLHEERGHSCFRHALAQQVVYESVPAAERRWLHLRTARALESGVGTPRAAKLAHHYRLAGRHQEFVVHAEAAAEAALAHGNDATAARFLLEALGAEGVPQTDRVRLALKLGRAAVDGLAHAEALPIVDGLLVTEQLPAAVRGELRFAHGLDLEAALRLYGAMAASRDIARICRSMRQFGVPIPYPWRGGRRSLGQTLSPKEHRVAALAAAGKTNQEIATELFLSRRTVESHVSSALRKLGCGSRKDLAAMLLGVDE